MLIFFMNFCFTVKQLSKLWYEALVIFNVWKFIVLRYYQMTERLIYESLYRLPNCMHKINK